MWFRKLTAAEKIKRSLRKAGHFDPVDQINQETEFFLHWSNLDKKVLRRKMIDNILLWMASILIVLAFFMSLLFIYFKITAI